MAQSETSLITATLAGDPCAVRGLYELGQERIVVLARDTPGLSIGLPEVGHALSRYLNGDCSLSELQRWASFVLRGYVGSSDLIPVQPVSIQFRDDEDLVSTLLARIDEFGDMVDGTPTREELEAMVRMANGN